MNSIRSLFSIIFIYLFFPCICNASKSPNTPSYTHSFFNAHGLRGVLDPSDRWDIYGNPIYADKKECESSDSSSEKKELTITEEKESVPYEESIDKLHQPEMEKIWHTHLSWEEIGNKIYGETSSDSYEDTSYSDNDSTESDDDETYNNIDLIDLNAEIEPRTNDEKQYPISLKEPATTRFLNACYTGCDDKVIIDFLEKYQNYKEILYQVINQTYPTPLFWSAINGNLYIVKKLLPYVTFENPYDRSALFYAVLLKRKEIVKFLLSEKCFYIHPDDPALRYHEHIDLISRAKTLKNFLHSEQYLAWTTYSPLKAALRNNDFEMVKLLIDYGAQDTRSIRTAPIPSNTDPRILDLLIKHDFLSPIFSQNKMH